MAPGAMRFDDVLCRSRIGIEYFIFARSNNAKVGSVYAPAVIADMIYLHTIRNWTNGIFIDKPVGKNLFAFSSTD